MLLSSYNGIQLLGRALSAFFDLLALVFMFFIGKRLYGVWAGLLAAALGAATVLQIQQAHFYTADSVATFFVVAAMFFIIRLGDTFSWVDTIAAAVASGLAVSSRINVAPIVGILAVALFVPVFSRGRDPDRKASIESAIGRLVVAGIITLITVRIFMPYAFDGLLSFDERWTSNMTYIRTLMSGENPGGPPGIQWADRARPSSSRGSTSSSGGWECRSGWPRGSVGPGPPGRRSSRRTSRIGMALCASGSAASWLRGTC